MLKTLQHLKAQLDHEAANRTPVLPQPPAGHFWRVTNELWSWGSMTVDEHYYTSTDEFEVQLHRDLEPSRFRKQARSEVVASQRVSLKNSRFDGFSAAELTVWGAEQILRERGEESKIYNAIKQVVGDYR